MNIDLDTLVFSNYGSYLSINSAPWSRPLGDGLYLRTHTGRGRKGTRELYRLDVIHNGQVILPRRECSPAALRLITDHGEIEICLPGTSGMRARTHGVGLRLSAVPGAAILHQPLPNDSVMARANACSTAFVIHAPAGSFTLEAPWSITEGRNRGIDYKHGVITLGPESELNIEECGTAPTVRPLPSFDDVVASISEHWRSFADSLPPSRLPDWESGRETAAYIDWCSVVAPRGLYQQPVMVMNKSTMDQVWSWDHCFNAMACCQGQPDLAWDQFMAIADHQDANGCLPDSVNQHMTTRTFTKPPIHGWAYAWCWDRHPDYFGQPERLQKTYSWMSAWSRWWLDHATWGDSKLPYYTHGNNSGWDNATIFDVATPTISPDGAAALAYQCDVLARIATALGLPDEARHWQGESQTIIDEMIDRLWNKDHFIGRVAATNATIECQSLITCMPIILGKRLPPIIRQTLATQLEGFLTPYGLASEHPDSPEFHDHPHAYWRSSVWPPPAMIAVAGLRESGYADLADRISERYCRATAECLFRENHNPTTGEGRSDYAFTWTASVSLMLAAEYAGENT